MYEAKERRLRGPARGNRRQKKREVALFMRISHRLARCYNKSTSTFA